METPAAPAAIQPFSAMIPPYCTDPATIHAIHIHAANMYMAIMAANMARLVITAPNPVPKATAANLRPSGAINAPLSVPPQQQPPSAAANPLILPKSGHFIIKKLTE